jgi:predicted RNA-binding Zn-ribbon protein involved in translation (DUF1610 family)
MGLAHNYIYDDKAQCHIGIGCHECGYRGKVRRSEWVPSVVTKISNMVWLVCKTCGIKEWLQNHTAIVPCPKCGSARFAEDDEGRPFILWSKPQDPDKW